MLLDHGFLLNKELGGEVHFKRVVLLNPRRLGGGLICIRFIKLLSLVIYFLLFSHSE